MELFGPDMSMFDFSFSEHTVGSLYNSYTKYSYDPPDQKLMPTLSLPNQPHDLKSPLPLGMDWAPHNPISPHDSRTGWSYCITIPSWDILTTSSRSNTVVSYRVKIGIQSPEGTISTREIMRRFNEFLNLFSELKVAFPRKILPTAPSKTFLRIKSTALLEERRSSLEEWMHKLLSDIDLSRSASVAIFLELEAAARSYFDCINHVSNTFTFQGQSNPEATASSSVPSDHAYDFTYEKNNITTLRQTRYNFSDFGTDNLALEVPLGDKKELSSELVNGHVRKLSTESFRSDLSSFRASEISTIGIINSLDDGSLDFPEGSEALRIADSIGSLELQFPSNLVIAFPLDVQPKMNRVLFNVQRRLATAKTDMVDLITRLNQEFTARQYLVAKVKDLEVELETTKQSCKDNMQQTISMEKERLTQMQWDIEELQRKCLAIELELKYEQRGRLQLESENSSIIQENERLRQELDVARDQLIKSQKHHNEFETKSKVEVKLLVKEVKSLRSSHTDLKHELGKVMKEQIEVERVLRKEKRVRELADVANSKLLYECEILRNRLQECSVSFVIEAENKLNIDVSSPYEALDLLATSDNRTGLLLAEAQLLAQDIESMNTNVDVDKSDTLTIGDDATKTSDDRLRKMLTDIFVENATLRQQVNSVIRCTLSSLESSDTEEEDEIPSKQTVLDKFLEK